MPLVSQPSLSDGYKQAIMRGAIHRLVLIVLMSLGSAYWGGVSLGGAFAVAAICYEFFVVAYFAPRFLLPFIESDPSRAFRAGAVATLLGSSVYACGWAPAFVIGGEAAGYFAAIALAAILVHNLLTVIDLRSFALSMFPQMCVVVVAPFLVFSPVVATALAVGGLVVILTAGLALRGRTSEVQTYYDSEIAREQAEAASAAKTNFLATMSHELRTPLNAVIGFAEMLEEDLVDLGQENGAKDASRIHRAARDLLGLINEVLDFSKIEAGRLEILTTTVDVATLLRGVVETANHIAKANNTVIKLEIDNQLGALEVDAVRLRQCALNLVSNACKFTNDGEVVIRARHRDEDRLEIVVQDTGVGISDAEAAGLFEPFVQSEGARALKHEGTGLGLAITRRLARLMGGDVECHSVIGIGSTFSLHISARMTDLSQHNEQRGTVAA